MRWYARFFLGVVIGASFVFFAAQVLGIVPTEINYCGDHKANYENCPTHYLVFIPLIWMTDHLDVVATIVTAIATAYIAKFTITLAKVGNRQIADTRILERAFISVEPGGTRPYAGEDDRVACDIIINNAGNLVAKNVSWIIEREYSREWKRTNFPFDKTKLVGDIVIAAKGKIRKGALPTNREAFDAAKDAPRDRAWLYVWGRVAYHDGFRAGRYIDFCHRYSLRGADGYKILEENGRYHEYGNQTDES
jgi:hypothetical protein